MPPANKLEGPAIGRARAHYGRIYHVVEVETYQRRTRDGAAGELVYEERLRVARSLCGFEPQQWNRPATHSVADANVHTKCRKLLAARPAPSGD